MAPDTVKKASIMRMRDLKVSGKMRFDCLVNIV